MPRWILCSVAAGMTLACSGPSSPTIVECTGELEARIDLEPAIPDNLRVVWNAEIVRDDCEGVHHGRFFLSEEGSLLVINDGGFGYTPPEELTVHVVDQGDCSEEAVVFSAVGYPVADPLPETCSSVRLEFSAADEFQCCCEHVVEGDILVEDLLDARVCTDERSAGRCVIVDPGRLTPHPCCPDATGETCAN